MWPTGYYGVVFGGECPPITRSTSSAMITGTTNCWAQWFNNGATTVTASTTTSWYVWHDEVVKRQETKRQKAAREKREREAAAAATELKRAAVRLFEEAQTRARKLLVDHLSVIQRDTLERLGYFDVEIGERTYRIRNGTHGNVRLVVAGVEKISYCIQPPGVPEGDVMLGQKLQLEANEAEFLRTANASRLGGAFAR